MKKFKSIHTYGVLATLHMTICQTAIAKKNHHISDPCLIAHADQINKIMSMPQKIPRENYPTLVYLAMSEKTRKNPVILSFRSHRKRNFSAFFSCMNTPSR